MIILNGFLEIEGHKSDSEGWKKTNFKSRNFEKVIMVYFSRAERYGGDWLCTHFALL